MLPTAAAFGAVQDSCTFDFFAVSRQKVERRALEAENLLASPLDWQAESPRIWDPVRQIDALLTNETARAKIRCGRRDDAVALEIPESVIAPMGGEKSAGWLHAYLSRTQTLANTNGGTYCLSFSYQGEHRLGSVEWGAYVYAYGKMSDGSAKLITCARIPDTWKDSAPWNRRLFSFDVPSGVNTVELKVRFSGVGCLRMKDLRLVALLRTDATERVPPEGVSLVVRSVGKLDDRFYIEAGEVGAVVYGLKCAKGTRLLPHQTSYVFTLPKGFEYAGVNASEKGREPVVTPQADGTTRVVAYMPGDFQTRDNQYPDRWDVSILVRATGPVGVEGPLSFSCCTDDLRCLGHTTVTLSTVPRQVVPTPKRFLPGAMLGGSQYAFRTPGATEAFADFLRTKGVRWLVPELRDVVRDPRQVSVWRDRGIRYITPACIESLSNGYLIGLDGHRPVADRLVVKKGTPPNFWQGYGICPAAVYEERPYFATNTWPRLAAKANGVDGMWCNWEPQVFRGCYCASCQRLMKDWCAKTGDSEEHFLSHQHAKLVKTLARRFEEGFGTGDVGFMPAIGYLEVGTYAREHDHPARNRPYEYAASLKWLPIWGPYRGWSQAADGEDVTESGPYNAKRGISLGYFVWMKDIRAEMDRRFGAKCPKLMAQPTGCNYTIQPEWLEISMDTAFFNRFEADIPWIFPYGCDARHWQAYGRSVARSARYEDVVFDGARRDEATTLKPQPGFDFRCCYPDRTYLPDVKDVPFLQQVTYDHQGVRYVACFNFDDQKHSEFTLRTAGLATGTYRIVRDDGEPVADGQPQTATALSDRGFVASVGASRCVVFEFHPIACE